MNLKPMYRAVNNSIPTSIVGALSATATAIEVTNAAVLPPGPSVATISVEDNAELVLYDRIEGNMLMGCLRGYGGTVAQIWPDGAVIYRAYTATDHNNIIDNIADLDAGKLAVEGDASGVTVAFADAAARENVATGETASTLWGKVKRFLADLKEGAFAAFGTGANDIARGNHGHSQYLTAETDPTVSAWAKQPTKPAYTATEVGLGNVDNTRDADKPVSTATLAALAGKADAEHEHSGYLTEETDPTVSAWAKAASKPSYTASEVGAVPTSRTINNKALSENITLGASDVGALPTAGGTLTGNLVAANPAPDTAAVRNISAGTNDMTAGSTPLADGTIYFVYE